MWAVMFFGPLAHLTRLAGGLTPFDIRPGGYSYADARAFLEAISELGRRHYAIPELVIDTFYPRLQRRDTGEVMAGVLTEALMGVLALIWLMRWAIPRRA
jgi:hypothetical protein